jgi:hypothetical protein
MTTMDIVAPITLIVISTVSALLSFKGSSSARPSTQNTGTGSLNAIKNLATKNTDGAIKITGSKNTDGAIKITGSKNTDGARKPYIPYNEKQRANPIQFNSIQGNPLIK